MMIIFENIPFEISVLVHDLLNAQVHLEKMAALRSQKLESIRTLVTQIKLRLPGDNATPKVQNTACNLIQQDINNANIDLVTIQFTDILELSSITQELVQWNQVFQELDELDTQIMRQTTACTFKCPETLNEVRSVTLQVGAVIRSAIARLSHIGRFYISSLILNDY